VAAPYDATARLRALLDELEGLNSKLAQPTMVKSKFIAIDNTNGSDYLVSRLFSESTPSRRAIIKRNPDDTGEAAIGGEDGQFYPLVPGEVVELRVADLSTIYARVAAGVKLRVYVLWEV